MSKELIERLRNTTYHNLDPYEAADRIEQLQRRIEYLELCCDEGERQLAASQAREQQLRAALETCLDGFEFTRQYVGADKLPAIAGWSWFDAVSTANSALSMPSDTTALEALIAKSGEVMRERCAYMVERQRTGLSKEHTVQLREAEHTIRAIPGVTLEDLK